MADDWLLLSDRAPVSDLADGLVEAGMFVVELHLPLDEAAVLLDFHSSAGWPRTFTLFHDPLVGLVLVPVACHSFGRRAGMDPTGLVGLLSVHSAAGFQMPQLPSSVSWRNRNAAPSGACSPFSRPL